MIPTRRLLRVLAVLIAASGAIDPAFTRERMRALPLSIVAIGDDAIGAAQAVRTVFEPAVMTRVSVHDGVSRAAPCPSSGGCVLVSGEKVPRRVTAGATVVGAVRLRSSTTRVMRAIDTPPRVPLNATSTLRVVLNDTGKRVEVFDDDVRVGYAEPSDAKVVDVRWTPIAQGARALRVNVAGERADVGVVVTNDPVPVLFYEPETTWAGTFVRRALADDVRFELSGRTQVAPPVAITRGRGPQLSAATVNKSDLIVVAAPDSMRTADVDLLERFVRQRGGSLVLVLDRRPVGPVVRLLPENFAEGRVTDPQPVGPLRATELVTFDNAFGATTLYHAGDRAVVISRALGRGRVIVSGALDAWRYRDAGDSFDGFWQSLGWDAAAAAGPALRLTTDRSLVRPHEDVRVEIETQTLSDLGDELTATGRYDCGNDAGALRLWPGPRRGTFAARFQPRAAGACHLYATVGDWSATTPLLVKDDARTPDPGDSRLEGAVTAYGGLVVDQGREDELVARVRERLPQQRELAEIHPMRSPWWIVPLVMCLGSEWLLRRRTGMR